jgi:cytoskeletal protein CcmA (bactofilin family)
MQDGREVNALLGKGSEFEGKLTFEGAVRIDGTFSGEIFTQDTLIIGEGARVSAQIEAGTVIVYGDVQGNITTTELIELHAPARLKGDIETPNLVIDRGVMFEGSCKMDLEAEASAPAPRPRQRGVEPAPGGDAGDASIN